MITISKDFFEQHATAAKDNKYSYTVPLSSFMEFSKENGVTKEMLDKVSALNNKYCEEMYRFAGEKLKEAGNEFLKENKNPGDAKITIRANTPSGRCKIQLTGAKQYRNIQTGENFTKTGVGRITLVNTQAISKDVIKSISDDFQKIYEEFNK